MQTTEETVLTTEHSDKPADGSLAVSLRDGFVPMPSDPAVPLNAEQLEALFAGDRAGVMRDIARLIRKQQKGRRP